MAVTLPNGDFDAYARTVIEITLPNGSKVSASAGERPPPTLSDLLALVVITAWNPGPERPSEDINRRAHDELLVRLQGWNGEAEPLRLLAAVGRARDDLHSEESIAVHGMTTADAVALARKMKQHAVVEIARTGLAVGDCRDGDHGRFVMPHYGFVGEAADSPGETRPIRRTTMETFFGSYRDAPPDFEDVAGLRLRRRYSRQGRITVVNKGPLGRGFRICEWCGFGQPIAGPKAPSTHRRIGRRAKCAAVGSNIFS